MDITTWIIIGIVALILLIVIVRILKGCLPKIIIGLIILAALAYLAYRYFTQ